ncbi:MAG: hypothetical protein IIA44_13720 [Acidobacteria bacterium]|nr:hypothetical protein [Acidobacteriota bacterium]
MDMMRRVGIVVAWLAATMVAMLIAATAVGSVRGQVTDVPAIPSAGAAALLAMSTTTTVLGPSTTNTPTTTDGTAAPTTTITVPPTASSTTTTTAPASTPTTTSPPTTTTTTTVPIGPVVTTHRLEGGEIRISALEPDVNLVSAFPFGGFSVEIDKAGPEEVRVEFESSDHESSFRARWKDGELDIDIEEES